MANKIPIHLILFLCLIVGCGNPIDNYQVNVDSIKTLPIGLYAFRGRQNYYSTENYMVWVNRNGNNKLMAVTRITEHANPKATAAETIRKYQIDTSESKKLIQSFIGLNRKYGFGHIDIDSNKIGLSYHPDISEQYVWTNNDSIKTYYLNVLEFRLLDNGWLEE